MPEITRPVRVLVHLLEFNQRFLRLAASIRSAESRWMSLPWGQVFYIFYKHESILPNWLETGDWGSDSKWTKKGRRKDSFVNE